MKRILPTLLVLGLLAFVGCTDAPDESPAASEADEYAADEYAVYGDSLAMGEGAVALTPAALTQDLGTYQNTVVRVEGTVAKVCQMKGCWLTLQNPTATPIRVVVPKDSTGNYVYTFPTDLGAQEVIVEGTVTADTTSVETLRHFAEDEGRPQAEIDAITEPEATVVLTARGALVKRAEPVEPAAPQS